MVFKRMVTFYRFDLLSHKTTLNMTRTRSKLSIATFERSGSALADFTDVFKLKQGFLRKPENGSGSGS